jgi:L-fuculose-phosphate aldolase
MAVFDSSMRAQLQMVINETLRLYPPATLLPRMAFEDITLGGELRVAAFEPFGSPELARAVGAALDGRLAALMANHGAVALGADLDGAVENALLVEWLCELYWRARAIGDPRVSGSSYAP